MTLDLGRAERGPGAAVVKPNRWTSDTANIGGLHVYWYETPREILALSLVRYRGDAAGAMRVRGSGPAGEANSQSVDWWIEGGERGRTTRIP